MSDKPQRGKARKPEYIGRIYKRKGNERLYVVLPRAVASTIGVPRTIATGILDTPQGRREVELLLVKTEHRYNAIRAGLISPLPARSQDLVTIKEAFDLFKEQRAAQRSKNSQRNYVLAYNAVMHHGDERRPLTEQVDKGARRQLYVEQLIEKMITTRTTAKGQVSPETCEIYARTFLIFLQWAFDEGMMPVMASRKRLKKLHPHMAGKPIRTYEDSEIEAMLAYCRREKATVAERRMGYLVSVLARTPLRIHEALTARLSDIDNTTSTLRVERKDGRTWEYVPLMKRDAEMLLSIAEQTGATSPAHRILGYRESSTSRLRRTFMSVAKDAGVNLDGRLFHEFKKTYITKMVQRVGKDLSLQEVARLARCGLQVLEKHYLRMGSEHLREKLGNVFRDSAAAA